MQIFSEKSKSKTTAIVLVLLMASVILFATSSSPAKAQTTPSEVSQLGGMLTLPAWATTVPTGVTVNTTVTTTAYMSVTPTPIGQGQTLLVNLWMEPPSNTNRFFSGYTVTITKPDKTTETVGPLDSYQGDATAFFDYVPDQVGNYTFQFSFPGNYYPAGYYFNGVVYSSMAAIQASPTAAAALAAINPAFLAFSGPANLQSAYYQPASKPSSYNLSAVTDGGKLAICSTTNWLLDIPNTSSITESGGP